MFADHMITMHRDVQTSPEEKFKIKKQFKLRNSVTEMYLNVFVWKFVLADPLYILYAKTQMLMCIAFPIY